MSDQTLKELRRRISGIRRYCSSCDNNPEIFVGDECNRDYNQAIDDVLAILDSIEEEKCN